MAQLGVGNRADGQTLYARDFPNGHTLIDWDGDELDCGLAALQLSMVAQRPELPHPEHGELLHIATHDPVAARIRLVQNALPNENFWNNFIFHHVAEVLVRFGLDRGVELALAIRLSNGGTWIMQGGGPNAILVWIYVGDQHYQAMRRSDINHDDDDDDDDDDDNIDGDGGRRYPPESESSDDGEVDRSDRERVMMTTNFSTSLWNSSNISQAADRQEVLLNQSSLQGWNVLNALFDGLLEEKMNRQDFQNVYVLADCSRNGS
jgi:hypothetical protein